MGKADKDTPIPPVSSTTATTQAAVTDQELNKRWKNPGTCIEGTPIFEALREQPEKDSKIVIGVKGNWYDVTKYIPYHPGGDILLEFAGRDATSQFLAFHENPAILDKWKPVGTYDFDPKAPNGDPLDGAYIELIEKYSKLGYFKTDLSWFVWKNMLTFSFLAMSLFCVFRYVTAHADSEVLLGGLHLTKNFFFWTGAILLAGFWQQSGFLMHDTMHNHVFHNRKLDQAFGWFYGSVCFGVSGRWWRDEHNEHHVFTNTVVNGVGCSDPQMKEDVWIQNKVLVQFFPTAKHILLRIQHITWMPVLIFLGPLFIKLDAYRSERRAWEFVGVALYWAWCIPLMMAFDSTWEGFKFWYVANCFIGVLEIQLLISHYSKPFADKNDTKGKIGWMRRQLDCVIDILNHESFDWFHGGLNIHSVHHVFPKMCRQHYRPARRLLKETLAKHGVTLDEQSWSEAIWTTLKHLSEVKEFINYDPRK